VYVRGPRPWQTKDERDLQLEEPMKKLVLESTAPFQGLPNWLRMTKAFREGRPLDRVGRSREGRREEDRRLGDEPEGLNPFSSHGKLLELGQADMYNACEWGNYCRVQDTGVGSRQVGRRGIVTYGAIVVRPDSDVYTAQQLANRTVGVPFYFGTHYLALHLLEGFLPREHDQGREGAERLALPLRLDDAGRHRSDDADRALHHACREERLPHDLLGLLSRHRSGLRRVDAATYGAFNRAVREAVKRINANKRAYLHYFIDYHKGRTRRSAC
jgi:NitT/TauT family transport system substrate-binding protein